MKLSKYTLFIDNNGQYIIYNTLSNALMICVFEVLQIIRKNANDIDAIQNIHPSLYNYLKEKKFIVPKALDETQTLIRSFEKEFDEDKDISITINPTMNCNLRCWYCYEKHLEHSDMSLKTMDSIKKLLSHVSQNGKTRSLHLSFFGGEPLLCFKSCVDPLIEYADNLCRKNNIELSLGFTSNAVLLSNAVCDKLNKYDRSVSFQIPFDGDRQMHNSIKKTCNGIGTYDITLSNLKYALTKGFTITLRCNYTRKSAATFKNLIEDVKEYLVEYKRFLKISFQRVWQDEENPETTEIIEGLEKEVANIGGRYYESSIDASRCYADRKNSFVINYNGDVFQCTAREFIQQNREGVLKDDGYIEYNEKYYQRMGSRFSNPECLECKIFPICNICTQTRLEVGNDRCIGFNFQNFKRDKLWSRITAMYKLTHVGSTLEFE